MRPRSKLLHLIVIFVAASVGFVSMSISSAATDSSKEIACETLSVASGEKSCGAEDDEKIDNLVSFVVQTISVIAGVIAVIMLIVGGLKFITSRGDPNAYGSARKTIIYAIVGLVVAAFAQVLVHFVLGGARTAVGPAEIAAIEADVERARSEVSRREEILNASDDSNYEKSEREYSAALESYEEALDRLVAAESKASASSGSKTTSSGGDNDKQFKTFKVASFNVLGYGHTAPGGNKASWPDGDVRFDKTMRDLRDKKVSVAALQEMHSQNQRRFHDKFSDIWGSAEGAQDFVIWRKDQWRKIEVRKITIPYFIGENRTQPFVLLEQRSTGKRIWFMGIHNPANVSGQVADRRKRALEIEIEAIERVKKSGYPIFIAGDFNDGGDGRISAQCMLTPMMKNVFGNNGPGPCGKPRRGAAIDHIFVIEASELRVSGASVDSSYDDRRISDHPMVTAIMSAR